MNRTALKFAIAAPALAAAAFAGIGTASAATEFVAAGPNKVVPAAHFVPPNKGACRAVTAVKVPSQVALVAACQAGGFSTPQAG